MSRFLNVDLKDKIRESPIRVQQEVTTRCTHDCSYCPRHVIGVHRELGDIQPDMVDLVLKRYSEVKEPLRVSISGFGEPLLWKGVYKFIKDLKDMDIYIELNTNGSELTESAARQIMDVVDDIQISVSLPNAKLFKKHKGCDTYWEVRENIQHFFELKGTRKPVTTIRFLKFPETEPHLKKAIIDWALMLPEGDGIVEAEFENWMGAIDETFFGVSYPKAPENMRVICADLLGKYLTITKEGDTYACCFAVALPPWHPTNLGNIKYYTIKDLLGSYKREALLKAQKNGEYLHQCGYCSKIRVIPPMQKWVNPPEFYGKGKAYSV